MIDIIQTFADKHPNLHQKMKEVDHAYDGKGVNIHHLEGSVWTHTMMVMKEASDASKVQKLAALCHDIGKAYVYKDMHETKRRRFTNHEAVSTFYTKEVLESYDITLNEKERVLKIVSQHGSLYNFFKNGRIPKENYQKLANRFKYSDFADLAEFYKYDHQGRFYTDESHNDKGIYDDFNEILDVMEIKQIDSEVQKVQKVQKTKTITILIGPPRSGKSTYVSNLKNPGYIISRDAYVEIVGKGSTYSEKWTSLSESDQKLIDKELQESFQEVLKKGYDIIVDMTNMSKKSRKKWLSDSRIKDYTKEAVVFIESPSCLMSRNTPQKSIPLEVTQSMIQRFVFPNYEEFDTITIEGL